MSGGKAPAGCFTLLYFAAASSFTNKQNEYLAAPVSVSGLFDELENRYPGIKDKVLSSSALTVNLDYVDVDDGSDDTTIKEGDEVAIIPPVSSG